MADRAVQPVWYSVRSFRIVESEIYQELLPLLNSRTAALLKNDRLQRQLLALERRTARGGKDSIDHPRGAKDDLANAAAGALVMAQRGGNAATLAAFNRPLDLSRLPGVPA